MKKLIFMTFLLIFALGFTDNVLEEVTTLETEPAKPVKTKTVPKTATPAKAAKPVDETKEEKPVTVKATIKLKVSKNIPTIKNGDVVVYVYEYDPLLADYPAEEVYYNDYSFKHTAKADTIKTYTFNIKKNKGMKYYAVIEVIDNKSLEVYRAKSTKDDIGKILDSETASQMFVVEEVE
ncbi:MAG: hypothetical protein KBF12_03485 [Sebaldella sp.]|nr:hypothetical protein [Sebaldella sp.]